MKVILLKISRGVEEKMSDGYAMNCLFRRNLCPLECRQVKTLIENKLAEEAWLENISKKIFRNQGQKSNLV